MQLIVETLERALGLGRAPDAERIAKRAIGKLDELLLCGATLDRETLGTVASKVASMTLATDDPKWLLWVIDLHRRIASVPSVEILDKLAVAGPRHGAVLGGPLGELLESLESSILSGSPKDHDLEGLARLQRTRRQMEGQAARGRVGSRSERPGVT